MKIAVFSDSHDNIAGLEQALQAAKNEDAEMLLHCGDLVAPRMLDRLGKYFAGPVHVVFGNNDADGRLLQKVASTYSHVKLHGIYAEVQAGDRNIAMIHYPEPALRIAQSGHFDLVCYGHDHDKAVETIGSCVLANPGEILGMKGIPTWGLYDTASGHFTLQELK
jgi:putative phosphoesterase